MITMKTDIEKIEAILKATGVVTFTDGKRTTAKLQDEWFLSSLTFDLNAIRELELLVIEKFGEWNYLRELLEILNLSLEEIDVQVVTILPIATADAETRITAMLAVIEEGRDVY
jgi:transcriptional/translational regulatory protein YebC/TACO1